MERGHLPDLETSAWGTDLPGEQGYIRLGTIVPVKSWSRSSRLKKPHSRLGQNRVGTMALVSWRDAVHLVAEDDLKQRTMRMLRMAP